LTGLQPLSENASVRKNGVAHALFVTKLQALGSEIMVARFAEQSQHLWTVHLTAMQI
jgi:hypothetical protein